MFHEMKEAKLVPDVITYNAMISACEKCDSPDHALALFEEMKESAVKPDRISYNALISACR